MLEEGRPLLADAPPGKPGGKAYEGRSRAQQVTEYLQPWNCDAVLKPNCRNEKEENRRDQYAPRRADYREQPAQDFSESAFRNCCQQLPRISVTQTQNSVRNWSILKIRKPTRLKKHIRKFTKGNCSQTRQQVLTFCPDRLADAGLKVS